MVRFLFPTEQPYEVNRVPPFANPLVSLVSFFGAGFLSCLLALGLNSLRSRYFANRGWNIVQMGFPFFVLWFGIPTSTLAWCAARYFENGMLPTSGYALVLLIFAIIISASLKNVAVITWNADTIVLRRFIFRPVIITASEVVSVVERDGHIRISSETDDITYNFGSAGGRELFHKLQAPVVSPIYSLATA